MLKRVNYQIGMLCTIDNCKKLFEETLVIVLCTDILRSMFN